MTDTDQTNWWLLYKTDDAGLVVAFAELLRLDDRCLLRTGKPLTWGLNEELDAASDDVVDTTLQRLRGDGFVVVREWLFDPLVFDARRFGTELLRGARAVFSRWRAQRPTFNAFALQTDESAMTIAALADVVDAPSPERLAEEGDRRLQPSEWQSPTDDSELDIAYRLLLSQHRDDVSLVGFDDYRAAFDVAAVDVLVTLVDEGFFGPVGDRVVLYDVTDSEPAAAFVQAWSKLNDPALLARFTGDVE